MNSQLVCQLCAAFRLSTEKHHVYTVKHTLDACCMHGCAWCQVSNGIWYIS